VLSEGELDQFDAVCAGQGDIEEGAIGPETAKSVEGFLSGFRLATDVQIADFFHEAAEAMPENWVIVDDEKTAFLVRCGGVTLRGRNFV